MNTSMFYLTTQSEITFKNMCLIILFALPILLIIFIYCAWATDHIQRFNSEKYRVVIKDMIGLLIIPLIINIFSNQLTITDFKTSIFLLIALFILYLVADLWDAASTNDIHTIKHFIVIMGILVFILFGIVVFFLFSTEVLAIIYEIINLLKTI